jgi:hypothetical protein
MQLFRKRRRVEMSKNALKTWVIGGIEYTTKEIAAKIQMSDQSARARANLYANGRYTLDEMWHIGPIQKGGSYLRGGTAEYHSLSDDESTIKPLDEKAGSWEKSNIPDKFDPAKVDVGAGRPTSSGYRKYSPPCYQGQYRFNFTGANR